MSRFIAAAGAAAFLVLGLAASAAQAGTITLGYGPGSYSGSNGGGEFSVSSFSGSAPSMASNAAVAGSAFQTFCVERDEYVTPGTQYNYAISSSADNGGANTNSGDPVSARTAYLYTQFYDGKLSNYTYTVGSGRAASATALQEAIWYLEDELGSTTLSQLSSQARSWVNEATTATSSGGSWYAVNGTGIGNVRILNITNSSGGRVQDQLVMVPLPPAAYAGMLLLAGLGAMRLRRRWSLRAGV